MKNIDCGYTLEPPHSEAVLTSTHNLCFEAKIRKNVYPCKPQFYFIIVGCKGSSLHGLVFMMLILTTFFSQMIMFVKLVAQSTV